MAPVGTAYGFTGELTDGNGLVYLRARYLVPALGTFASRDPWRGTASAPRTWNGYAWVEGNVVNRVDGSGMAAGIAACESTAPVIEAVTITELTANTATALETASIPGNLPPSYSIQASPVWYFMIDPLRAIAQAGAGTFEKDGDGFGGWGGAVATGLALAGMYVLTAIQQSQGLPGSWGPTPNVSTVTALPEYGPRLPSASGSVEYNDLLEFLDQFGWGLAVSPFRITGFDRKLNTLAEHIANLLKTDVAGTSYNPKWDPNDDDHHGWCRTIRRIVSEINDAQKGPNPDLTPRQLLRDLRDAGYSETRYNVLREAFTQVRDNFCEDFWDDFDGGSFALD